MDAIQIEWLWSWLTLPMVVLFLGVLAGHTALHVFALNHFLGWPWPRWFSRIVRRLNTLVIFAGPVLFWLTLAFGLETLSGSIPGQLWLGYLALCGVIGFVLVPLLHLYYLWKHQRPQAVTSNHGEVIDIAKDLGYKPIGHGKNRRLALLPGNQIYTVELNEKHLQVPELPEAWEGLTILHLTDLHFKGVPDKIFFQKVLEHCQRWQPDLVAVTGDIVDSKKHHRWIIPVLGRLRWGIAGFAILGNHDQWYEPALIRRRLRRVGLKVLGNGWEQIDVRGQPMVVIGHEGPWFSPEPDLSKCPDGFRLCLSHTPDNIGWAKKNRINLMLSGHNHGGQIRFPFIGSVYVPSKFSRRYDCGTFHEPHKSKSSPLGDSPQGATTLLHVGRGLGGQHPVRFNCRPEVTLLVLHRAK